jgi:hypothetical protein
MIIGRSTLETTLYSTRITMEQYSRNSSTLLLIIRNMKREGLVLLLYQAVMTFVCAFVLEEIIQFS